jgi:hypothetical protein
MKTAQELLGAHCFRAGALHFRELYCAVAAGNGQVTVQHFAGFSFTFSKRGA